MTSRTSRPSVAARQTASWLARKDAKPKVWWSREVRFISLLSFAYCSCEGDDGSEPKGSQLDALCELGSANCEAITASRLISLEVYFDPQFNWHRFALE